jgi:hypothetical protein
MCGGTSYHPLDDFLPPPHENVIEDIGEVCDDAVEMQHPNPTSMTTNQTDYQMFEKRREVRITRQHRYLEVI